MRPGRDHRPRPDPGHRHTGRLRSGLDAPTHISVAPGVVTEPDAAALPGVESVAAEGGESLTLSTRQPARVLTALAERDALDGLAVRGATLEDVFLELTGREYRA